jgi:hypothetical protein
MRNALTLLGYWSHLGQARIEKPEVDVTFTVLREGALWTSRLSPEHDSGRHSGKGKHANLTMFAFLKSQYSESEPNIQC